MKKVFVLGLVIVFALCTSGFAIADNANILKANEKKAWEDACTIFPAEHRLNVQQFKEVYDRVMAGQEDAYLVDLRTHPEFYAAHIPGTEHIHAGHMYTFPKKIKNKDAKIVLWCRTHKRGA
ncbi:MAG: rhodanese-like domain-containing protein, partial [Desulfosarcina sp.]|nr:rhodanese-like domain-containing protein [Desulfobacterales bacterium]